MKKNADYEINFAANTITVTRKFLAAASNMDTKEGSAYSQMQRLRELNMPIIVRTIHRTVKETRWPYDRMEAFLKQVENSEAYLADFKAVKSANKHSYGTVWAWFKKNFPNYAAIPELNDKHQFMVLPADYLDDNPTNDAA